MIGTFALTLTVVPYYIYQHGMNTFQTLFFFFSFISAGLSITLGYHRLFSHMAFQAAWPVRFLTLLFGSAAFEGSALEWCRDHRTHHKHVDHEEDPYDISKGFFHAHIGWLLFKLKSEPPFNNVADLKEDKLVMFQHNYYHLIAMFMGFVFPALVGYLYGGAHEALGAFLISGVARIVCVQHSTFFINSLCHCVGKRPYSSRCSARDSGFMALFTFGEGYHNYHHEFQHDYRNGVKPWQFDPTKWSIWLLNKFGLAKNLRRVPDEKRILAEISEKQRVLASQIQAKAIHLPESLQNLLNTTHERLVEAAKRWEICKAEYYRVKERQVAASREKVELLKEQFHQAAEEFYAAIEKWKETHQVAKMQLAAA